MNFEIANLQLALKERIQQTLRSPDHDILYSSEIRCIST